MLGLLTSLLSSFAATLFIIRYKHLHERFSADSDLSGPQKFHLKIVPRIGGISIAIGLLAGMILRLKNNPASLIEITILMCAIPTFAIGLTEDLTKQISVKIRILCTAVSALLLIYLVPAQVNRLDIPYIDIVLTLPMGGVIFTAFAITGLANAYNIIDGFNGLAGMVGIITLTAIAYISFVIADPLIMYLSLIMIASILGFFVWNYPNGLIFLGDGGAYLIGFWIASLSVLLTYRHQEISPWFALLINGYPIVETLFTIYRRSIHQGKSPGQPDGMHFHTLIYRRILSPHRYNKNLLSANSRTAPYLWVLSGMSMVPAVLWWHSTPKLLISFILFSLIYVWIYKNIVQFKSPRWIKII